MAKNNGQHPYSFPERRPFESRRSREFYSYYESVLSHVNSRPKLCDLRDPNVAAAHEALPSADKALTAFLQLAAMRLQTRRAMLFFFDSDHAYVIAESTRTLSLEDSSQHQAGDSLWLGFTKIPRGFSVCEVTADLPANEGSNARDKDTRALIHIVNNLAEDTRFCGMPYVTGGPHARFYAGVPITTPNDLNIGVLCVLDDKPRDGLTLEEVEFLRGLAGTIMEHLETIRIKTDHSRSHAMTTALGAFVEGKSSSQQWWLRDEEWQGSSQVVTLPSSGQQTTTSENDAVSVENTEEQDSTIPHSLLPDRAADETADAESSGDTSNKPPRRQSPPTPLHSIAGTKSAVPIAPAANQHTPSPDRKTQANSPDSWDKNVDEASLGSHIRRCTERAAQLLRVALGADEVFYLDACPSKHGGYHSSHQEISDSGSDPELVNDPEKDARIPAATAGDSGGLSHHNQTTEPQTCDILGSASGKAVAGTTQVDGLQLSFEQRTLRAFLRRYPRGRIWHFDGDDDIAASAEDHTIRPDSRASSSHTPALVLEPQSSKSSRRRTKLLVRTMHRKLLQTCFPGVRSLMFLGMWNFYKERWFGAVFIVSYGPMRIFSARSDLTYLAAFCDVLLAEIARMEAQVTDQSKNDFISSISHELRSPLHGILGSAECLEAQAESHDVLSRELVRSITSSGITLLDIINDLLEYSRLSLGVQEERDRVRRFTDGQRSRCSSAEMRRGSTEIKSEEVSMLSALTEAAVEAACSGFEYQRSAKSQDSENEDSERTIILDIDDACNPDWHFAFPGGSWKRICMNLVTNALRYTPAGHISISLSKQWLDDTHTRATIKLVVEDTGQGMSDQFQAQDLFRAFKQENHMSSGTGLGLNLVAQIVRSHGGTVQIRSEQGTGTCVEVNLPCMSGLPRPVPNFDQKSTTGPDHTVTYAFHGLVRSSAPESTALNPTSNVLIFDPDHGDTEQNSVTREQVARKLYTSSLRKACRSLNLQILEMEGARGEELVVCIVHERDLRAAFSTTQMPSRARLMQEMYRNDTALIVVCQTRAAALAFKASPGSISVPSDTQFLWLPTGAVKLASTMSACMATLKSKNPNSNEDRLDRDASGQYRGSMTARAVRDTDQSFFNFKRPGLSRHETPTPTLSIAQLLDPSTEGADISTDIPSKRKFVRPAIQRALTVPHHSIVNRLNLLLVDDNPVNLRILELYAEKAGHQYQSAENGFEAFELYKESTSTVLNNLIKHNNVLELPKSRIDVILFDVNMPIMDGYQAAQSIRPFEKESGLAPVTIIAVSGLGDSAAERECRASGIDLLLTKPVRYEDLVGILEKLQSGR